MIRFIRIIVVLAAATLWVGAWHPSVASAAPPVLEIQEEVTHDALSELDRHSARADADIAKGAAMAEAMGRVVGVGLSPIFGLAGYGMYDRYISSTPTNAWYSHPAFVFPLAAILLLIVIKDVLGAPLGPAKQMADAGEVLANKAGGCLGLIATAAHCAQAGGETTGQAVALLLDSVIGTAHAADVAAGGGEEFAVVGGVIAGFLGAACNAAVWLTGQAFTVGVFLNPFSLIDPMLKAARASVIAVVAGVCGSFPVLGLVLAGLYILFAWLVAGFCLRLISWGSIISFDLLFRRGKGDVKDEAGVLAFASKGMAGPPARTLGYLHRRDGEITVFSYKPWLVLPQKTHTFETDSGWLVEGLVYSAISNSQQGRGKALCTLPPRYRGKAESLVAHLGLQGVGANRALSGIRGLKTWIGQLFGKESAEETA